MVEYVKLEDAATFVNGFAFKPEDWKNDGLEIVRIQNLTESSKEIHYYDGEYEPKYEINSGDVLISWSGSLGVYQWTKGKALLNQHIFKVVFDKLVFDKSYFIYLISQKLREMSLQTHGSTMKHITKKNFDEINIPYLKLDQQKHISKVLDTITSIIEKRKQQIALLEEAEKSLFVEMFGDPVTNPMGWDFVKLGDISTVGSSKRVFVEELKETGIPFYRGTEIGMLAESIFFTPKLYITKNHYDKLCKESGKPSCGDLLLPSICPDGRIWMVDSEYPFYFKDGRVLWIHSINESINVCYLKYALKEKFLSDYHKIASGTTFAEMKIFTLKSLDIMRPPLELQKNFSSRIDHLENEKKSIGSTLSKMIELKSAMMQEYFG